MKQSQSASFNPHRLAVPCISMLLAFSGGCSSCGDHGNKGSSPAVTTGSPTVAPGTATPPSAPTTPEPPQVPVNNAPGSNMMPPPAVPMMLGDGGQRAPGSMGGRDNTVAMPPAPGLDSRANEKDYQVVCKKFVETIAGTVPGDALPANVANAPAIRQDVDDLALCEAIAADAKAPCLLLPKARQDDCLASFNRIHQLKSFSTGTKLIFDEEQYQDCKKSSKNPLHAHCDEFRDVAQSGDLGKCPKGGQIESACRAFFTLDKSLCNGFSGCEEGIESAKRLNSGLKKLAESGTDLEKLEAHAALGGARACEAQMAKVRAGCVHQLENQPPAAAK